MSQFVNMFLNTPSYIMVAVGLVLIIIFAKKTKRMLRRISGFAFSVLTILKLVHMLGLMDLLKK